MIAVDVPLFELDDHSRLVEPGHADRRRVADGLTCLRDVVPEALTAVARLEFFYTVVRRGSGRSGDWCYEFAPAGLRFDVAGRWDPERWPAQSLTWVELRGAVGDDPRLPAVAAWYRSVSAIDAWKDHTRPFELWPDPEGWHPSYLESDRRRAGYEDRLQAWRTVQAILTDAITRALD